MTPAAISQQIRTLEDYLGFPVFHRLTRAVELTVQGSALLPKIREGFECLSSAVEMSRHVASNVLRITAPPSFATRWLVPRLPAFMATHPELELRLASSPDTVDSSARSNIHAVPPASLRDTTSEIAIRYGTGDYPGYQVERLFTPEYLPVCSPDLLSTEPPLQAPADLGRHRLIHDETIRDEEKQPSWAEWMRAAGVTGVDAQKGPRYSNAELAVQAALDGQGIALAMRPLMESALAAGRLVIPFSMAVPSPYSYFMVTHEAVAQRPVIASFRNWLLNQCNAG